MASIRPPRVQTVFDVANWFMDRALNDGEYLQPQKLHRLMYLAQAYHAAAFAGRRLMPAVFVADPAGPLEPNLYRALQNGRDALGCKTPDPQAVALLDSIWRKFGAHSVEHLTRMIQKHPPFAEACATEPGSVITEDAMAAYYGRRAQAASETAGAPGTPGAPAPDQVFRPRVMRSQTGEAVSVMPWLPKRRDPPDGGTAPTS
ncbi:hypothetical protein IHV25_03210 [Phaeovibrio sulfidiphilus]|uniref:Antitoxin SocA-like Panacea domain-containing protein n=1 Tax=Phaeovibrio sulfidiphilus TaxID=1220600 RepID=A0A8J7CVS8_9PROT|nr:hypothetical protein [Phaeovibrio sulfidiphilus]MBE1236661.1 hypothetical protein [Phaeovibrio sulfidiphilus]